MKIYPSGTTVTLKCTFQNDENVNADPQSTKLIIRNYKYEVLEEVTVTTKEDVGKYYHHYITPEKPQTIIYEWIGELDGLPSVKRGKFTTQYV